MANHANHVIAPCKLGIAQTTTNVPNSGAAFRATQSQPPTAAPASSEPSAPVGPQRWPLSL